MPLVDGTDDFSILGAEGQDGAFHSREFNELSKSSQDTAVDSVRREVDEPGGYGGEQRLEFQSKLQRLFGLRALDDLMAETLVECFHVLILPGQMVD